MIAAVVGLSAAAAGTTAIVGAGAMGIVLAAAAGATATALATAALLTRVTSLPGRSGQRDDPVLRGRCRRTAIERGWPDTVELILLAINAGLLPRQALTTVAPHATPPIGTALRDVEARCLAGERFADALGELSARLGPPAHAFVDGLAAADRYGIPLTPVLAQIADDARQRRRRNAEARVRQLPVRLAFPLVLCTLPAFVLLAIVPMLIGALSSLRR